MPMNITPSQARAFADLRNLWFQHMRPFDGYSASDIIEPLSVVPGEALAGARLLASRDDGLPLMEQSAIVAEVGTQEGNFARKILDVCRPKELHIFDLDLEPIRLDVRDSPEVSIHIGDSSSALKSLTHEAPNTKFDWIYVDGDHSYDGVARDTEAAVQALAANGILWFNDYTIWSPVEMTDYGVPYVVNELLISGGWQVEFFAFHPLMYCDIALKQAARQV